MRRAIICGALALTVTTAKAEDISSANYVMPGCWHHLNSSNIDSFGQGRCVGLVEALFYTLPNACPPNGVTVRQAVLVVATHIAGRPARMHEDFKDLAREALRAAWPCRK
jgi:hypothetical protein